ncbi:hypothetical protein [Lacticaseibacillus nasuensis]|uniref:LexA family protein n=1 Tax=Lacticaseibacillus nasuensis TaxID=944671 RepID=UPI0006D03E59|nr:hypothetical protein [Lacticaseibacillus nasuensis]
MRVASEPQEMRWSKILAFMAWKHASWQSPSIREIGRFMGWRSPATPHSCLAKMADDGLIEWRARQPQTLRITAKGRDYLDDHRELVRGLFNAND